MTMLRTQAEPSAIERLTECYSVEMTARDTAHLREAACLLPQGTRISITYLPGEGFGARVEAASTVRALGFVPVPHLSARRITSQHELDDYLQALSEAARIEDVFVIAGDPLRPAGPYEDALALIRSGLLVRHGIRHVGIAGYPEGHPQISEDKLDQALRDKHRELIAQKIEPSVVTQFGFDAAPVLRWLARIRSEGITAPVRVGLPGPANVGTLLRFAARCGVAASAGIMKKYGASITRLLATAGPETIIEEMAAGFDPAVHGQMLLHLYPFGGFKKTAEWMNAFVEQHAVLRA